MEISNSIKSIAVTGANSYIGINLIKNCINKKIVVKAYCRDPSKLTEIINNDEFLKANKYNSYENNNYNFEKVDAIIHLAHHRIKISRIKFDKDTNITAANNLINQANYFNIKKILYLSSHLAHEKTLSQYGKSKLDCERFFIKNNFTVVRSGFVFGGTELGLYQNLLRQIRKNKILPIIFPNSPIYPIHVDDLSNALINIIQIKDSNKKTYCLGNKNFVKTKEFFYQLGIRYCNKEIKFLFLPGNILYFITFITGYYSGFFNTIFERVAGLKSLVKLITNEYIDESSIDYLKKTKSFFINQNN